MLFFERISLFHLVERLVEVLSEFLVFLVGTVDFLAHALLVLLQLGDETIGIVGVVLVRSLEPVDEVRGVYVSARG